MNKIDRKIPFTDLFAEHGDALLGGDTDPREKSNMKHDKIFASFFLILSFLFIYIAMTNTSFFEWVFERHQNQWSWYVRPLFLIPICFFAYQKSLTRISASIFALFTSMFWFNQPDTVSENIIGFLEYEKQWLQGEWGIKDFLFVLLIPISFYFLDASFWKKSIKAGAVVLVLIAIGKIAWSVLSAGEFGTSIIIPAILGLALCFMVIFFGFKKKVQ